MVSFQQREFRKNPSRLPHDQPYKSERDTEVEQVHGHVVFARRAEDHLVEVQPVTEHQKYGHKCYSSPVALGAAAHEDQQRSQEVDYQVEIEDALISSFKTGFKIDGLF